ncbi:surface lipoprotein assembly modifier [Parvularcula sp. LCG005]|uniref:surface lipoprotein assembly modifier n=1 Tax=Parvularcula sp. LCG005 TaxID=3078805 RepID=UPI0029438375|nr:surface lipoprotein assembly modifier [Parvularcula sp. LCG005]WOI53378.1 surface lipoprotein assembly modifier [Parvularcula sp. LCG005]
MLTRRFSWPFSFRRCLMASAAGAAFILSAGAEEVTTTGQQALLIADRLVTEGHYDEAEQILRTLATGDGTLFDMRPVDRLAAKIALKRGNEDRALDLLEGLVAFDPADHATRMDLIQVLMKTGHDRRAARHLRHLENSDIPAPLAALVRKEQAVIEQRRTVRFSVNAAAAPSTNINSATSSETFDFLGFIPLPLDDEARAQSGIGVNWGVGGSFSPILTRRLRGHMAVRGSMMDYTHSNFDQAGAGAEIGLRLGGLNPRGLRGSAILSANRRFFGGDPYADSVGLTLTAERLLTERWGMGIQLSAAEVDYDFRPDRNGPVLSAGVQSFYGLTPSLTIMASTSLTREEAEAKTESNTQWAYGLGAYATLPAHVRLGVSPTFYTREYDALSGFYGRLREDETLDIAVRLAKLDWSVAGFSPSLNYRYTDNDSTISLFSYEKQGVDIGFTSSF